LDEQVEPVAVLVSQKAEQLRADHLRYSIVLISSSVFL
jgi:hypothetical protein